MNFFSPLTRDKSLLKDILGFAVKKKIKLFIVGGYLRDIFLKRSKDNPDIDFCLESGAIKFGMMLARELKAGFVVLDKEHGACRIVKKSGGITYTLDFTDFRGRNLSEDIRHRDFTVNCLVLELKDIFAPLHPESPVFKDKDEGHIKLESAEKSRPKGRGVTGFADVGFAGSLLDLCFGLRDIQRKIIRAANRKAFDEDPLRMLRAFSLKAIFGFRIEKDTLSLIKAKASKLAHVSYERIRDELFKVLERPGAFAILSEMDKIGLLSQVIPEIEVMRGIRQGPYHHLDVWQHSLETLRQMELLPEEFKANRRIRDYLKKRVSAERTEYGLMKLAALLHDIGKPATLRRETGRLTFHGHERVGRDVVVGIARRLRLANDEVEALSKMILWHLRPGYLADNPVITARAKFRYFRDTAQEAVSTLMLSVADQRSTKGRLTSRQSRIYHERVAKGLIKEYFKIQAETVRPRLINGDDLIREFRLAPSPLIGRILREIEELQAIGKIKNKKEALEAARTFMR